MFYIDDEVIYVASGMIGYIVRVIEGFGFEIEFADLPNFTYCCKTDDLILVKQAP